MARLTEAGSTHTSVLRACLTQHVRKSYAAVALPRLNLVSCDSRTREQSRLARNVGFADGGGAGESLKPLGISRNCRSVSSAVKPGIQPGSCQNRS